MKISKDQISNIILAELRKFEFELPKDEYEVFADAIADKIFETESENNKIGFRQMIRHLRNLDNPDYCLRCGGSGWMPSPKNGGIAKCICSKNS